MNQLLPQDYIDQVVRDARRYQGQWTGSAGSQAAHAMRLVREREVLMGMIAETHGDDDTRTQAEIVEQAFAEYRQRCARIAAGEEAPVARRVYGESLPEGRTAKFGTGAVRSDTFEEFRYDLISPIGLREVARTCAEGAQKYSDFNWERGMPVHDLLNHAIAHIYQFLSGDRAEPHLPHAAWNLLAAIHSAELWPAINAGTLRGPSCKPPEGQSTAVQ